MQVFLGKKCQCDQGVVAEVGGGVEDWEEWGGTGCGTDFGFYSERGHLIDAVTSNLLIELFLFTEKSNQCSRRKLTAIAVLVPTAKDITQIPNVCPLIAYSSAQENPLWLKADI